MSWKRALVELGVRAAATCAPSVDRPDAPSSIFVLRNNDIGDLLIVTPLFEALRRTFPAVRLVAGVGEWNLPVLANNPHISEAMIVSAPWHNQQTARYPVASARGIGAAVRYILFSPEARALAGQRFTVGIDVLGSPQGALLMLRSGIPYRLGVREYAGGHSAAHRTVTYDPRVHVGRAALGFAELLGATALPDHRPQLFLTDEERVGGERRWHLSAGGRARKRIVIAPGGGFAAKRWPLSEFRALTGALAHQPDVDVVIIGGKQDVEAASVLASDGRARSVAGKSSLRETFAIVAAADLVVCNSSMAMHVAAAFAKPSIVVLGAAYDSARQHAEQWSSPEACVLGKEPGERSAIATAADVLDHVQRLLFGAAA